MSYTDFTFQQKTQIVFGKGAVENIGELIKSTGAGKVLLTTGGNSVKKSGLLDRIVYRLEKSGMEYHIYSGCTPNPRSTWIDGGACTYMGEQCDFILAVGGGSVIDASKAIAMLVSNPNDGGIWYYVSGKGRFINRGIPLGVVLTVAATGSECNGSFVISNNETLEKMICTDESARPVFSVCDPEITYSVDKWHTACGISDIISHVLEQYLYNDNTSDVSDGMSIGVLKAVVKWGPVAIREPENYDARANLMWASTIGMNGILGAGHDANWITHMLEHAVSAVFDVSHGAGIACLTPYYLASLCDKDTVGKLDRLGIELFGIVPSADLKRDTVLEFRRFFQSLGMPVRLGELVSSEITENIIDAMAVKALPWGPMAAGGYGNFTVNDAKEILRLCAWHDI